MSVPIAIEKYEENILFDIVPKEIGHIIFGRPWQFDHNTYHEGYTNKIKFSFQDHKFILCPLTPHQVREDEIKLK